MSFDARILIEKIEHLPPDMIAEVIDFVDFLRLRQRDKTLTREAAQASAVAFAAVWDNAEDDAYDAL